MVRLQAGDILSLKGGTIYRFGGTAGVESSILELDDVVDCANSRCLNRLPMEDIRLLYSDGAPGLIFIIIPINPFSVILISQFSHTSFAAWMFITPSENILLGLTQDFLLFFSTSRFSKWSDRLCFLVR